MLGARGDQISYQRALFRYVAMFILLPAVAGSIYLLFMDYRSAVIQAHRHVAGATEALTGSISLGVAELGMRLAEYQADEALGAVATNILYHQFASKRLEQLVTGIELVDAAVIQDGEGYMVAGFPLDSLGIASATLQQATAGMISRNDAAARAQLFVVDDETTVQRYAAPGERPAGLYMAVPLHVTTRSLQAPRRVVSVLWARLDAGLLLSTLAGMEWAESAEFSLASDGQIVTRRGRRLPPRDVLQANADTGLVAWHNGQVRPLLLSLQQLESVFTESSRRLLSPVLAAMSS